MTRRVAVGTIVTIWLLAGLVSFVPISFGLHRPETPFIYEDNGKKYPTCALDLTPTYAVVSSCISFYVPCIVMIGIYCRYVNRNLLDTPLQHYPDNTKFSICGNLMDFPLNSSKCIYIILDMSRCSSFARF